MLYCVVRGSNSIREIEAGLGIVQGKLNQLGIEYVPPSSTLSDGNKKAHFHFVGTKQKFSQSEQEKFSISYPF